MCFLSWCLSLGLPPTRISGRVSAVTCCTPLPTPGTLVDSSTTSQHSPDWREAPEQLRLFFPRGPFSSLSLNPFLYWPVGACRASADLLSLQKHHSWHSLISLSWRPPGPFCKPQHRDSWAELVRRAVSAHKVTDACPVDCRAPHWTLLTVGTRVSCIKLKPESHMGQKSAEVVLQE